VQTSYNTHAGKHYRYEDQEITMLDSDDNEITVSVPQPVVSGQEGLRKNYAGIGYVYDEGRDAFYEPQPYASWTLDEDTCLWEAPTPCPDDGKFYVWEEAITSWFEVE
jgi:hypothetical protein